MKKLLRYVRGEGLGPFLVRAVAGSGAVQFAGMVATFLLGVLLARGLGVEGYGQYGIAMAVISIGCIPGEFGLAKLVTREVAAASGRRDLPEMFEVIRWADKTCCVASTAIAAITLAGTVLLLKEPASPVGVAIMVGLPVIPLVGLSRIRGAALQGLHFVVLGQISFDLIRPVLLSLLLIVVFTFWPGASATEAMALNSVTAIASLALAQFWLRRRLPRPMPPILHRHGRRWLASAIPMALADGLRILQFQLGILLLGILGSSEQVGLFRIAVSTVTAVAMPTLLVNVVISPVLARLFAQADMRRIQQTCTHSAQAMTAGVLFLALPIFLWGPSLLTFVFGRAYAPAIDALLLLSAGQLINAAFGPNAIVLTMTGHEKRVTRAMLVGLLLSVLLTVALVPAWGDLGAAAALVCALIVWNLLMWLDAKRFLGIQTGLIPSRIAADGDLPQ